MTDPSEFQAHAAAIGCTISREGAERLLAFLAAMLDENQRINLTAVREYEAAVMFHALDSVALGSLDSQEPPREALDIGTGNGFPGVAIACLFPKAKVYLLDRTLKKLRAIERCLERVGFNPESFETIQMDAAEAPAHDYGMKFDLVTARAVVPPADMGRLAEPLLAPGGRLVTWLSEDAEAPKTLAGGGRKIADLRYTLPAPADRVRRLVQYGW